jgi:thiosulfate/3-mercaptopyruvate sulfurtransferase
VKLQLDRPLVETDWLAERLDHPGLRIVDARWRGDGSGRALYRQGHIPRAVHLDWHLDLSYTDKRGLRDLILPPDRFAAVMAAAGIGDDTAVVAYAESDYSGAARLWWSLRYYGHDQAAVLNGGLDKWVTEGRPLSRRKPATPPARFTPRPRPGWLATAEEIQAILEYQSENAALVDTRPPEQYAGHAVWTPAGSLFLPAGQDWVDAGGRRMRGGHIPGAASLPSSGNLDPTDWTFLSPQVLRERALAAGIRPEQRVITYCGVGISASLGLFALHLAGYNNLALYDASWEEWGSDPERPVTREESPDTDPSQ